MAEVRDFDTSLVIPYVVAAALDDERMLEEFDYIDGVLIYRFCHNFLIEVVGKSKMGLREAAWSALYRRVISIQQAMIETENERN